MGVHVVRKSWGVLALVVGAVVLVAGCQEDLTNGAACPALCPDTLVVKDTLLPADVVIDTAITVFGFPPFGTEAPIVVADYERNGQRVRTAAVVRFDELVRESNGSDDFETVDSAALVLKIAPPPPGMDSVLVPDTSVTILVYDVDTAAMDLDTAAVRARFASEPIASRTITRDSLGTGTVEIPLDSGFVAPRVRDEEGRIRLGITVQSARGARILVGTSDGGAPASIHYVGIVGPDSVAETVTANTDEKKGLPIPTLADYMIVLQATPAPPDGALATGGIPARRAFIRFKLPPELIDSAVTVVRANLELHQIASPSFPSSDTLHLLPFVVRATPAVTNIATASVIVAIPGQIDARFAVPLVTVSPAVAQVDTIPIVNLFRLWRQEGPEAAQRAIVLETSGEGLDPRQYFFHSTTAAVDSLRPRLRVTYIPRSGFGLPR